ncbi:MAG TPA: M23 family metallopeptidase, partial [Bacillota bacterium]
EVPAAAEGTVAHVGWDPGGFGRYLLLAHGPDVYTIYAHLSMVQPGTAFALGAVVGRVGKTGHVTGPHLHFGIYVTDPATLLLVEKGGVRKFNKDAAVDPLQMLGRETRA